MYHPFSVADTIKTAWYLVKKNFSIISIYSLIGFIIVIALISLIYLFFWHDIVSISICVLVFLLTLSFILLGFIKLVFQLIDKEYYDFDFSDIIPKIKMVYSYLLLFTFVFTIFFAFSHAIKSLDEGWAKYILGIAVAGFFQFFLIFYFPICACFIVDDSSGPFESVLQSFRLIRGNFLKYLLLFAGIEAMVFIGIFTVLGMVFAVPFSYVILVVAYRKLVYSHQDVDDDLAETK